MAISLGDIASFATGVVDADTAATTERLKDRRAELQADRQLYIDMKTKKYESELKSFEAEDKKYKAIQSVNAKFAGSEEKIVPSTYGKAYLMETNPQLLLQYQTLYKENPNELNKVLSTFGDKSVVDFKTSTSRDALDTKLKTDINTITAGYKTALENARGDSKLINAILGKRDKDIQLVIEENKEGEIGAIAAKEIAAETDSTEARGFDFGAEPEVANTYLFRNWKKDSKIQDLRKAVKDKVSSINKATINTTLNTLGSLNISLPKQFLTFDQGKKSGTITGIKDNGKIVAEHITLLDNQALNFMSNEWIFGKDTDATNVSNYYSAIEAKNLITSRVRDYSSEGTVSQQKKGFWSDRENFVGFVPFSVVGLDNNFMYKEDGGGVIINSDSRKQVGSSYYQALKKIAMTNDPEFKDSTEAEAINKLQDKLLKLKEGNSSNLLTQVKNEMATSMKLDTNTETSTENSKAIAPSNNETTGNENSITVYRKDGTIVSDNLGNTVENIAKAKEDGFTFKINNENTTPITDDKVEGDSGSVAEQVEKATTNVKKIKPVDVGSDNQSGYFDTLSSILAILPNEMSGQEIMDKYNISFPINKFTKYSPSK